MASFSQRTARPLALVTVGALGIALAGCSAFTETSASADESATTVEETANTTASDTSSNLWDTSTVHEVSIDVDDDTFSAMVQTYLDSGEKEWISANVTIDGVEYTNVGIKLKGNSSLRDISADTPAAELPIRIRLDKFVDDQNADGVTDFTIRSNNSETSLNEAVALDGLEAAGLATEHAAMTRFSVNGSDAVLRLSVQGMNDDWLAENFPDAGEDSVLYKSESEGTWEWLGEDADYSEAIDIEAGEDDYAPLVTLLDLLNNGTQEEIAQTLPELVDLDSFATYLAYEELIDNFDDIDGPGNNSYLLWDSATEQFTVVAWDHNLAFGEQNGGAPGETGEGGAAARPGGEALGGEAPGGDAAGGGAPGANAAAGGAPGAGGMEQWNPLAEVMSTDEDWAALVDAARASLQETLIESGVLTDSLEEWAGLIEAEASDLIDSDAITADAEAIRGYTSA